MDLGPKISERECPELTILTSHVTILTYCGLAAAVSTDPPTFSMLTHYSIEKARGRSQTMQNQARENTITRSFPAFSSQPPPLLI